MNFNIFTSLKGWVISKGVVMTIPIFKGMKDEDLESFLKNYKRACIRTGSGITRNWITFLLEFLEGTTCQWYERQPEATKLSWEHLSVGLITEFGKNDSYEALIIELSQIKQGCLRR